MKKQSMWTRKIISSSMATLLLLSTLPLPLLAQSSEGKALPTPTPLATPIKKGPLDVKLVTPKSSLSADPTDFEIEITRLFPEPLFPNSSPVMAGENAALAKAVNAYKAKTDTDDVSSLTQFLTAYPNSRWCAALELNVARIRFETGHFEDALSLWTSAWNRTKGESERNARAIANRSVASILLTFARLGKTEELGALLAQIDKENRRFSGFDEQMVESARGGLQLQKSDPGTSFKCGPFAVNTLLNLKCGARDRHPLVESAKSTSAGTSLVQVRDLAKETGLDLVMVKREKGAPPVVPSILHWKVGHFAALIGEQNGRYLVKDSTFDQDGLIAVSRTTLDEETDYYLVTKQSLPSGWKEVSDEEGKTVWGKGQALAPDFNMMTKWGERESSCGCTGSGGMARASIWSMQAALNIQDTPLEYSPPKGPSIDHSLNYNHMESNQPATFTFTNLGANWTYNWLSYLTVASGTNTATVRVRGGGSEVYKLTGGVYSPNVISLAVLTNMGGGTYKRTLPDGSEEIYNQADGSTPPRIFMTQAKDPQGNTVGIAYDGNFRLTSVTDSLGQVSTISYVSNTVGNVGFYKIAQITDPFSRSCSFSYDSTTTNLISITDVIGITSSFTYETSGGFINSMTTPYGTTTFINYVPSNTTPTFPPRGVRIMYPDGSSEVLENWIHEAKATYYWDRHACELFPSDPGKKVYTNCKYTQWTLNPDNGFEGPTKQKLKYPFTETKTFNYGGNPNIMQAMNRPLYTNLLAMSQTVHMTIGGTTTPGDILRLGIEHRGYASYTVQASDTLETIAKNLAAACNASSTFQTWMVEAAAFGNVVVLSSAYPVINFNAMIYQTVPTTVTETITPRSQIKQTNTVTLSANPAPVPGSGCALYVDPPVYKHAGKPPLTYVVQAGDTPATIANVFTGLVNGDTVAQTWGVSAVYNGGNSFTITSYSPDPQSIRWAGSSVFAAFSSIRNGYFQLNEYEYNSIGKTTKHTDELGRVFTYSYDTNKIDLLEAREVTGTDNNLLGHWEYNSQHLPLKYIDSSSQPTEYTYNAAGQLLTVKDANNNTTTMTYSTDGYLQQIDGPLSGSSDITSFTYDSYGRLFTTTDSEGYTLTFYYDLANRPVKTVFPDGTTEETVYDRLDAVMSKDRVGRWSETRYDSIGQVLSETDPLGRKTQYQWCSCGSLSKLTDPAGNVTLWEHDLQGRPTKKTYPDGSKVTYAYDPKLSRLRKRTDALNQSTVYVYNPDNKPYVNFYVGAINPTGSVRYDWDLNIPRVNYVEKNDWGKITYAYNPYVSNAYGTPTTGGGMLASVTNNVIPNSAITYSYDNLGRTTNRSINGSANSIDWSYDAMSRITSEVNALGTFGYNYVDNVSGSSKGVLRLDSIDYPNSQKTKFSWYGNTGDQRLKQISNLAPNGSTLSQFNYGYNPAGEIKQWGQLQGKTSQIYGLDYDEAGQLTGARSGSGNSAAPYLNQNYYAYDFASNRSSVQTTCAQNVRVGGTATASDVLTITVKDPALGGGQEVVNYTVVSSETPTTIAANFAAAITANANLQTLGVNAVSSGATITLKSASSNLTSYSTSLSGGATETLTLGVSSNFVEQAVIGGTKTTGDVLTLKFFDAALPSGTKSVAYTVTSPDTLTSIATNITSAINADTDLQSAGITATSVGTAIIIKSASANPTTYDYTLSTSATETISLGINLNNPVAAAITGTKTTGDTVTLTVYDSGLPGGSKAKTYTVQSGDNLAAIANGLVSLVNGDSDLQAIAVSATSSGVKITLNSNSINSTAYRASASSGATENLSLGIYPNATQTAAVGGTKTTSDVVTISVFDEGLSGGKKDVSYTVLSGDNLSSIATGVASAINADTDLQGIGVSATAVSTVVNIASGSVNATTYSRSLSAGATETVTLGTSTGLQQAFFNNTNAMTKLFSGGAARFEGATNKAIKSASIATSVLTSKKTETLYSSSTASANTTAPTVTLTNGINTNGTQTVTVGGTVTAGNVVYVTTTNLALPGGSKTDSYTVATGNTINNIATNLASAISSDTDLQKIGVSASAASAVITITSAATTFSSSLSGGATETVTYGTNVNGNVAVSLGGKATNGDTVSLIITNSALSGGSETIGYTVASGNTLADVAAGLVSAWNANTELQSLGLSASNSAAAQLAWSQSFSGNGQLAAGMNTAAISALDGGNNTKTNLMQVSANAPSTVSLTFDANGDMTSDGVNSFSWDAENRLIKVTYPGSNNFSSFTFDPYGRNVKIVETVSGSATDTKQFVWCSEERCEERDGTGTLTKKFLDMGQTIAGTGYFYLVDHLNSVKEMCDNTGAIQVQYQYDSYGRVTKLAGGLDSDFQYAGYYTHLRSGLSLTLTRSYSCSLGRWINRDSIDELGGLNLYAYCGNEPINHLDPSGRLAGPAIGLVVAGGVIVIGAVLVGVGIGILLHNAFNGTPRATTTVAPKHKVVNPVSRTTRPRSKPRHNSSGKPPAKPPCDSHGNKRPCDPPVKVPGRWPETYSECQVWCGLNCPPEEVKQCEERCKKKGYEGPSLEEKFGYKEW